MERKLKVTKEISRDKWYIPYEDVIYRMDGYVISDLDRDAVKQRILANTQKFGIRLDYSDDSYVTLDGDEGYMECHSHPEIVRCFPANTLKMNEDFKKKLLNGYQKCV